MSTVVGATVSESSAMSGQSNRSGLDFQILSISNDTVTLQVTDNPNASRITFNIYQDKTGSDPKVAKDVGNGSSITGLKTGTDYYIGNPSNAGGLSFGVMVFT